MRIGLDYHGLIDQAFPLWSVITKSLVENGHEVHIITGGRFKDLESDLKKYKIKYTHFFSITEHLERSGIPYLVHKDKYTFDNDTWNKAKAKYCKTHKISYHFDDTETYGKYFTTPFFYIIKQK